MPLLLRSLYKRLYSTCVSLLGNPFPTSPEYPRFQSRLPLQVTLLTVCTPATHRQR